MKNKIKNLIQVDSKIQAGDRDKIDKQHKSNKLTARERINLLFDAGSFMEMDKFAGSCAGAAITDKDLTADAVVTGYGTVDGRLVFAYAQDYTVAGGAIGKKHAEKIAKLQDMALKMGAPIISFIDSNGGRIEEGIDTLAAYANIIQKHTILSGLIPQISVIAGPCMGSAVFIPAMADFVFMVNGTSSMFLNGPQLIKANSKVDISQEELGGALTNNSISGTAHFAFDSEEETIAKVKELISFLPSNNLEDAPMYESYDDINRVEDRLNEIIPSNNEPYDMKKIIELIADDGYFFEVMQRFAENIITGFIRLYGKTIGVVANQPKVNDGLLNIDACNKAARFIRTCNAFNIPLLNLVDVASFEVSKLEEHGGIIRHGAKLIYAYAEATVPKVTLVIKKAYGSAFLAMCSKDLGADLVFAWPSAQISVLAPEGAANILYKGEIASSQDPIAMRKEKIQEYIDQVANPYVAANMGYVDDIIYPSTTRPRLISAFDMLGTKREIRPAKKHGNMPV